MIKGPNIFDTENFSGLYFQFSLPERRKLVSPNIDLRIVFTFLILCISALQWSGWNTNYQQALEYMYHVDKYRMMAKREADARGLLLDKKAKKGKTQIEVKEEEKVSLPKIFLFFDDLVVNRLFIGLFRGL